MRILLIEDDEILSDRLIESLSHQQYVVDAVADGQEGLEYAQSAAYDLIISDVGLPIIDGILLCKQLRDSGCSTPILLMTAKDAPDERIRGLDAGADDYLTKPLNLEELHARVRALLRRGEVTPNTVLQAGPLQLDPVSCKVTYGERALKLTPKEYSLLELFLRSPNRVFSRSHIIEHLWSFDDPPLEDSVKAHIKGLRRKLKQVGAVDWIENVYGIGYRFTPQVETADYADGAIAASLATQPSAEPGLSQDARIPASTPPADVEQAFQASMTGLWSKYQGLMAQRLEVLTATAAAIRTNTLSSQQRSEGMQAAHKLAGVLGMFEQDEGSDLARKLETVLETDAPDALPQASRLIEQLVTLVQVPPAAPPAAAPQFAGYQLIISADTAFGEELQAMGAAAQVDWRHVHSLGEAEVLLQTSLPDLLIIDIAAAATWIPSLDFIQSLLAQAPALPIIALTTTDSLIDRVAIARAGVQRLISKPVAISQLWEIANRLYQKSRGQTAQIFAVDDDPLILKSLRYLLEPWGLGVTGLDNPNRFWDMLKTVRPDLLILDVEMPDFTGIELCQAVRTDPTWQDIPVLFLTSHRDAATIQDVFRVGADDYISKPIVGPELLTRILNRLERNRLLQTLSHRDAVTGLANYTHSKHLLGQYLEASLRDSQSFTLVLIKLEELPSINLQYGHEAGYTVLQSWGQCFQTLRESEAVGYWGMGEFIVGLPKPIATSVQEEIEPLLQSLRRQIVTLSTGERIQPTFSWAIATYPTDGHTLQSLYQFAQLSLQ